MRLAFAVVVTTLLCATLQVVTPCKEPLTNCSGQVELVSRAEWGARPAVRRWSMALPVSVVIIEHTGDTKFCRRKHECMRNVQLIQEYHLDWKGWHDIAYNFLIGGDGRVYEGLGWDATGAHAINFNTKSLGVAFLGNFNVDEPTEVMLTAARGLIDCGVREAYLAPTTQVHGHRDVACIESPGSKLYAKIRNWEDYTGGRIKNFNDCSGKEEL